MEHFFGFLIQMEDGLKFGRNNLLDNQQSDPKRIQRHTFWKIGMFSGN
jgi:hypothetical protein